jgi:hypothetical protein
MFAWIPLIGPILQGLFNTASSIYTKFKDTQLGMRNADVEEAKVSAQIIHDTNDDIGIRILRDLVCLPVALWTMLIGWDTIVVSKWPYLMWHVEKYPDSVGYLPYAVLTFLLGNIGINAWKRK